MPRAGTPAEPTRIAAATPLVERLLSELKAERVDAWPAILQNVTLPEVASQVAFDPARYTRTLLAADEQVEVLLMGWLPGQSSAVHDHGRSEGAALVLAGEAEEESFLATANGAAARTGTRTIRRGQATIERRTDIHRIFNASTNLLVTLHAYAPRLTEYQTYDA